MPINYLDSLGLLQITGDGAKKLLQGQCTCNLDEISATQTRLGAHCNPQGRIISFFRIFQLQDTYFLQMPRTLIPIALSALKKYAVFFKAELNDVSGHYWQIGCIGGSFPLEIDTAMSLEDIIIIRAPGDHPRFEFIAPPAVLEKWFKQQHLESIPADIWHSLNMNAGIAAIYPETSEKFLPHELNLPQLNAVSFNKGCYTGQEIIARMEYRGKLKQHLYQATIKTTLKPERGADIYQAQTARGILVDYAEIGYNHYQLLVIAAERDSNAIALSLDPENSAILEFK